MERPESGNLRLGFAIFRFSRGCAVAILGLALYVGLTNWQGSGSFWTFAYAGIALAVFVFGLALRYLLSGR